MISILRVTIVFCSGVNSTFVYPTPINHTIQCPNNQRRKSVETARGVDGCTRTTTKPVTIAPIMGLTPKSSGTVRIAAVKDTLCENRGSCAVTARTGGSMKTRPRFHTAIHTRNSNSSDG
jgi:hypothetical protein